MGLLSNSQRRRLNPELRLTPLRTQHLDNQFRQDLGVNNNQVTDTSDTAWSLHTSGGKPHPNEITRNADCISPQYPMSPNVVVIPGVPTHP